MESLDILGCGSEDVYLPDHDELCAIQAGQLLNMGCFGYETSAYACAFFKNQKVYYYISDMMKVLEASAKKCVCKAFIIRR